MVPFLCKVVWVRNFLLMSAMRQNLYFFLHTFYSVWMSGSCEMYNTSRAIGNHRQYEYGIHAVLINLNNTHRCNEGIMGKDLQQQDLRLECLNFWWYPTLCLGVSLVACAPCPNSTRVVVFTTSSSRFTCYYHVFTEEKMSIHIRAKIILIL